jgi:hypothetical protein
MSQTQFENKYLEIISKTVQTIELLHNLEKEYEGKLKGGHYQRLETSYKNKLVHLKKQVINLGLKYCIIECTGIGRTDTEWLNFKIYFTDIDIATATRILPVYLSEIKNLQVKLIKPGEIIFL